MGACGGDPAGHGRVGMVTRLVCVGVLNAQKLVMLTKALGLTIPQSVLVRADQVIE